MYTVKGIKSFQGEEGYGFNATLYRDGKKVATVSDYAHGGPLDIRFTNEDEEVKLQEHVRALPVETFEHEGKTLSLPLSSRIEVFLNALVDRTEELNSLFRKSRKNIYFIREGKILSTKKATPTEETIAIVRQQHKAEAILSEAKTVAELEAMLDRLLPDYLPSITKA